VTEHKIVKAPIVDPLYYRGGASCWFGPSPCPNPARWMPVPVFVAEGYEEDERTRIPAALLHLGTCDACRAEAERTIRETIAPDLARRFVNPVLHARGRVDARFVRIEWVQIAKEA
jgi:hypothetical protein